MPLSPLPERESASRVRWMSQFAHQVARSPDSTAVISGASALTYRELDERSNRIANLLIASGIGAGHFVGLGFHRGIELPAALLGIIKSGAAYVPLDPSYPEARIAQMVASARLSHVVTNRALASSFPGVEIIAIDDGSLESQSSSLPENPIHEDELIYAIFTSGSTGQPKAASVFHRGFQNLIHWYAAELGLGEQDKTLVISSPSFDLTQKNFVTPLITGGTLILDDCQTYDISRITGLIRDHGVTLVNCTPSAFYPLVDAAAADGYRALSSLRFAVLGGEPISIPRLRAWLEHPNCHAEVVNSYGPTECADICAFHRLHRENLDQHPFVPLGKEIPNVGVSIRDESFQPLPDGEIGELCISGIGLGGGYLNDPDKTAAAFTHGIYRTGDLARRLPDGLLEFRGRADHQVKVNGFRIELGEIEIALNRHEGVREAVVIADGNRLIAHVQGDVTALSLREHLSHLLPAYMIPGEFIQVEAFPLTPNGKVDRLALARTRDAVPAAAETGGSLESKILALWSEILGRPLSDATANFFDIGGNSIHLAVVHIRLMKMTGKEFPITELFALPTARAIAGFLAPKTASTGTVAAHDRARMAQAGFSRFRPTSR